MKSIEKVRLWRQSRADMSESVVARYPLKIQAIRSKKQQARLYVYFPLPLAAAIGLGAGDEVEWELLDRGELHLVRLSDPGSRAQQKSKPKR